MKNNFDFDNFIKNKDELIKQLESLKEEAKYMMKCDIIFQKDFHALKIVINYLKNEK